MERLWSPWRYHYVTTAVERSECVFCEAPQRPDAPLVVHRGVHAYVILNLYPYNSGHLMVVTNRHVDSFGAATREERAELIELTRLAEAALFEVYCPQGLNVGVNLGRPAGAGVVGHLHVHLVPRWNGDTNFMSVVGEVRVLPEDLERSAERLRPVFGRLAAEEAV